MKRVFTLLSLVVACLYAAGAGAVKPVEGFEPDRYLGRWYEIARIDHRFEKGLSRVSADYRMRPDGGLTVVNRGYAAASGRWKQSTGKAYFVGGRDQGHLKVSFFGPFYGQYIVFDLDRENYRYALVGGKGKSYFWLLSRTPTMDPALRDRLIARAVAQGFRREDIILVDQSPLP